MKILILCTGNSCRSQMAEGFFKSFDPRLEVYSAGTVPAGQVNPYAVKVMNEIGIDISTQTSDHVDKYIDQPFDYVITVCDDANEKCPVFVGQVKHRLHIGFDDPADATGTDEEILPVYRRVRDEIGETFEKFFKEEILNQL
ncbi:MAG: arsenate reductase ArsC [Bacteroidales bacterium]|nr:arsenate reductase ArsC [Bacteroidales bacterium]